MIHLTNTVRLAALFAAVVHSAGAATLSFEATMHAAPSESAEVVGTLPAGASVNPVLRDELAATGVTELPPGWIAVKHAASIEGFVRNRDIGKDFAMKPDSPLFAEATEGSEMLATVGPKDLVETGDPVGRYSKATFRKEQIVFVNSVPPGSRAMIRTQTSAPSMAPTAPATVSAPVAAVGDSQAPGATAPDAIASAPRTFEGYLLRTRRILGRGPKLDYQLVDENNQRIVLLDMSALLVTEPIEFFEGRMVRVYGPGITMEGVTEAIIRVENLRLAR